MIQLIRVLFAGLQFLAAAAVLYLSALALAAVAGRPSVRGRRPGLSPRTTFLVLVPAHDEGSVLGRLVDSIHDAAYPRELVDVVVIADNCTDRTPEVAREHGARCWERRDPDRGGKGHALDWATRRAAAAHGCWDAFVVVDADSVVDERFFECLDAEMQSRPGILQAHQTVLNPADSAFTAITALASALQQYLKPLGRTALGLSPRLLGDGMCFPAAMLDEGWKATSISEDLNHYISLLLSSHRTRLVPDAVVRYEMPVRRSGAKSQRVRWEKGKLLAIREHVPTLLREAIRRGDLVLAEAAVDVAMPPFAVLVTTLLLIGAGGLLVPILRPVFSPALWGTQLALLLAYLVAGAALAHIPPALLVRAALVAPVFLLWKLWIQAVALIGIRDRRWVRTPRAAEAGEDG